MAIDRRQFLAGGLALTAAAILKTFPGLANGTADRIRDFQKKLNGEYKFFSDPTRTKPFSVQELAIFGEALREAQEIQSQLDAHHETGQGKLVAPYVTSEEFPDLTFHGNFNGFYIRDHEGDLFHVIPYHAISKMGGEKKKQFLSAYTRMAGSDIAVKMGLALDLQLSSRADFDENVIPRLPRNIAKSGFVGAIAAVVGADAHGLPRRTHSLLFPVSPAILKVFGVRETDSEGNSVLANMWMPFPLSEGDRVDDQERRVAAIGRSGSSVRVLQPNTKKFIPFGSFLSIRANEDAKNNFPETSFACVSTIDELIRAIANAKKVQRRQ